MRLQRVNRSVVLFLAFSLQVSCTAPKGPVAKLLPDKVGKFERWNTPEDIPPGRLIPEITRGMAEAANAPYHRPEDPLIERVGVSVFRFVSDARAIEVMQFLRLNYPKQTQYKILEDGSARKGWFRKVERLLIREESGKDRHPNGATLVYWRSGSVIFYAESYHPEQLHDVTEFEKNFPY